MYNALNSKSATANKPPIKLQRHCKSVYYIVNCGKLCKLEAFCTLNLIKLDL